jgi:hypothetical protein
MHITDRESDVPSFVIGITDFPSSVIGITVMTVYFVPGSTTDFSVIPRTMDCQT